MRITKELERTKHDLEQKFSDSAQYQNMKMMLSSKNEQLRELRGKLSKFESIIVLDYLLMFCR
jgi:leucine zipper transcription factor-like protein 1